MADEYLDVVDEQDNVIGKELKSLKYEKEFISRAVTVLVKDSSDNFIVVRRASHKKSFPNCLDLAVCGHVKMGEDYKDAAKRELAEELSLDCEVKHLKTFYTENPEHGIILKYFCSIFIVTSDDDIDLNEEAVSFEKYSFDALVEKMNSNPDEFCPFFIKELEAVKDLIND